MIVIACHFWQCTLEIGSASAEGGRGGGGWVHKSFLQLSPDAAGCRNDLVALGGPFMSFLA